MVPFIYLFLADQIGLSPEEVISKIMANPDVAMAFQNPRVQQAIMDVCFTKATYKLIFSCLIFGWTDTCPLLCYAVLTEPIKHSKIPKWQGGKSHYQIPWSFIFVFWFWTKSLVHPGLVMVKKKFTTFWLIQVMDVFNKISELFPGATGSPWYYWTSIFGVVMVIYSFYISWRWFKGSKKLFGFTLWWFV